jgi:endonuclease/exonuclease/phosphatase family metal-dependent hydrolase
VEATSPSQRHFKAMTMIESISRPTLRWDLCTRLLILGAAASLAPAQPSYTRQSGPEIFSYGELVTLGEQDPVPPRLQQKLSRLLSTPFVNNEAFYRKARPNHPNFGRIGPGIRLVQWNIERGLELDNIKLAFTDSEAFVSKVKSAPLQAPDGEKRESKVSQEEIERIRADLTILHLADVLVLNEVDWGIKRTDYRCVVCELGIALNMNWAWGVEFVEVDPMILGAEKFQEVEDPKEKARLLAAVAVDQRKLHALHGTAVLSRYPIREARLVPFEHPAYDWYSGEKNVSMAEKGKRAAAVLVGEKLGREIRRGGRTNIIVDLDVPDLPERTLRVVATHLENRADPEDRRLELEELLRKLRDTRGPVIIAGDMNTTGSKSMPRSTTELVKDKFGSTEYAVQTAVKYATGLGIYQTIGTMAFKNVRFQGDPTAAGVKLLAENPERALFQSLEKFRFADGASFDFRGEEDCTSPPTSGTLADSNQRADKGFTTTFQFDRTIGAKGKFRLDWIFVKAYSKDPRDEKGPYRFAPHFPHTLSSVNYAFAERISDHNPISVDLPFQEPKPPSRVSDSSAHRR